MTEQLNIPAEYLAFPATLSDRRWLDLMMEELRGWSKHNGNKHAAVITGPTGEFRAMGYNGLPRGIDDGNPAFNSHPLKRQMTLCAERNALRNLALAGGSAEGCTLHADAVPCDACAEAIVATGIKTVVMVDALVHATHEGDNFWRGGLERLKNHGLELRHHDPDALSGNAGREKIYHTPIPSGMVDWESRYLNLAKYLERWTPGGAGEVLARRENEDAPGHDKMTRALGCWSKHGDGPIPDVFDDARLAGIAVAGCTLYLSNPEPLATPQALVGRGLAGVMLPRKFQTHKLAKQAGDLGIQVHFHRTAPQDFASLVKVLEIKAASVHPHSLDVENTRNEDSKVTFR